MKKLKKERVLVDIAENVGKLPPSVVELEQTVLGAAMLESGCIGEIADILRVDDFYQERHKLIWEAIISLYRSSNPVDMRTVINQLKGQVDALYIAELTSNVSSAANVEYHARVIIEASIKRSLIVEASKIHTDCYQDGTDVFSLLDSIQTRIDNISANYFKGSAIGCNELYRATVKYMYEVRNNSGVSGISSGYLELDRITGGWQAPDLVIVAARPSMGKTVVGVCLAKQAAMLFNKSVAFFSLEMSARQIMQRMISSDSEIDLERIIRGNTSDYEFISMGEKSKDIANARLFIDETPAISILELRAKAKRLKHEQNIDMIVIDYLQLMRGDEDSGNREQEVASISRGLKSLAKELNIPVIALSQLSRGVESRSDKRPQLSDLRESGSLEQDADVVLFLFRAEYYNILQDQDGNATQGKLEIIAAKNRNGKTGSVMLNFIGKFAKITDLSNSIMPPNLKPLYSIPQVKADAEILPF